MSCVSVAISVPQYPTHHREFDSGGFVFVPGERQRVSMLEYEERDFAMREESIAQGRGDPDRTFPKVVTVGHVVHCGLANILPFEAF